MRRIYALVLTGTTALALAGCGGSTAATVPTAAPAPTAAPTATIAPTAVPTATPAPTATTAPTAVPTATPMPTMVAEEPTPKQLFADIDMTHLEPYTYETGLFTINIPASWKNEDHTTKDEVIEQFNDVNNNGLIVVDILDSPEKRTEAEMIKFVTAFLDQTFGGGKQENFIQAVPKPQPDGSVLVTWSYDVAGPDGTKTKLVGNTFIEQQKELVSLLSVALPNEQLEALRPQLNEVVNSYKLDTTKTAATP